MSPRQLDWLNRILLVAALGMLLANGGCARRYPPITDHSDSRVMVGPYDITLSSHREALGL